MSSNNDIDKHNKTNILGQKIKETRKSKKLTQKALGELIGKSPEAVRKYETGERQPPLSVLYDICKALDVPVKSFIPEEDGLLHAKLKIDEMRYNTTFESGVSNILESLGYTSSKRIENLSHLTLYLTHERPFPKINMNHRLVDSKGSITIIPQDKWEQFENNIKNYFEFELFKLLNQGDK